MRPENQKLMRRPMPATLSASHLLLRLLIILNWVYGAAIFAGLIASFIAETPVMTALGVPPSPQTATLVRGMEAIALLGLASIPLHYLILRRLLDVVGSVGANDPFVSENANRLRTIAWALFGLQLLSVVIGTIARLVSTPAYALHLDAGFSTGGWLAVLLLFVLARVFAEGARMRDDIEGTV